MRSSASAAVRSAPWERQIEDIRSNAIKDIEAEAQQEAGMVEEQELRELNSEFAVRMSQLHEETDRRLMQKRNELTAQYFQCLRSAGHCLCRQ